MTTICQTWGRRAAWSRPIENSLPSLVTRASCSNLWARLKITSWIGYTFSSVEQFQKRFLHQTEQYGGHQPGDSWLMQSSMIQRFPKWSSPGMGLSSTLRQSLFHIQRWEHTPLQLCVQLPVWSSQFIHREINIYLSPDMQWTGKLQFVVSGIGWIKPHQGETVCGRYHRSFTPHTGGCPRLCGFRVCIQFIKEVFKVGGRTHQRAAECFRWNS